ncbi:uncharacterized protein LOC119653470 isoform X2 [Hermetia illucens]|uniref:uncharacterized protein LOC119653470 isoform X2 n=1 Tax=Hermetia illucens TaxID=343691 RepID=UPI0018CC2CD1|nr:uncharacterized protein LOC119653470 isoform X2 [Hermetia illucens]
MDSQMDELEQDIVEAAPAATGTSLVEEGDQPDNTSGRLALTVTSDEDSRESAKVAKKESPQEAVDFAPVNAGIDSNPKHGIPAPVPLKRRRSILDWSSDEEDFAGFDECNGDSSENSYKRIKEELPSEGEQDHEQIKSHGTSEDTLKSVVKSELDEAGDENKPPDVSEVPEDRIEEKHAASHSASSKQRSIKDPIYKKPFALGWKREVVYRAIPGISKDKGEVYYITPMGKKIRTRTELQLHLTHDLQLENFTFAREPIGMSLDEEKIRVAKPTARTAPAEVTLGKRIPKPKGPKGASPPPQGWTPARAVKSSSISSPRSLHTTRMSDENENKSQASSKSTPKTSKLQKKNSSVNQSSVSLTTGEDVQLRKRGTSARSSKSSENVQLTETSSQPPRQQPITVHSETFATHFFSNVSTGYQILLQTFQYLKVQELLRAACVCRLWNVAANHRSLWRTVRMKNSQVNDWTGLAAALKRNGTQHLDLRKMISSANSEEMWSSFSKNIKEVESLEIIDLCRCSSQIVEDLFISNPKLKVVNAIAIKDDTFNLENVHNLESLEEFRLKSIDGFSLESDLHGLKMLKNLRHLSLTSVRGLGTKDVSVLGELTNLESLDLGECCDLGTSFATDVLVNLVHLNRLRLEKGQENCCTIEILEAVSQLEQLQQLELVNFDIKTGFDEKMSKCKHLKRLLLIPTYISQSATTNNIVLSAVLNLSETLQFLTWVVTLELLRVTALYVDQCDNKKKDKKFFDESIPVLKPVPGIVDDLDKAQKTASDVPQVEILPLVRVEEILIAGMPTTKFKILKVPYHATWRQNLVDI